MLHHFHRFSSLISCFHAIIYIAIINYRDIDQFEMLNYSRNVLMSLHSWWKVPCHIQISRHIVQSRQQQVQPLPPKLWSHLKSMGLLRKFRGGHASHSTGQKRRIKPIISIYHSSLRDECYRISDVERRKLHIQNYKLPNNSSITRSNLIEIKRLPIPSVPISTNHKLVDVALLNSRSVKNKAHIIKDFVVDHNIDLLAITETWLRPNETDEQVINEICPAGYNLLHVPRESRGGGVGLMHKKCFKIMKRPLDGLSFTSFELIHLSLRYSSSDITLVIVYRPPNNQSISTFFDEFSNLLEKLAITPSKLLILGDFNFHVDTTDPTAVRFINLLESFNLTQLVTVPTHKSGHTLDLVICREDEKILNNLTIIDPVISDHLAVRCSLSLNKPAFERKELSYRKLRSMDLSKLKDDIANSDLLLSVNHPIELEDLVDKYYSELSSVLNKHAPIKKRIITLRPASPWYSTDIKVAKCKRRKLERRWRSTRLTIDRELFVKQSNVVNKLIATTKHEFYSSFITDNKSDQQVLFNAFDKMVNRKPERKLPSHTDTLELANQFAQFFTDKITVIRSSLASITVSTGNIATFSDARDCSSQLSVFSPTNDEELSKLVGSSVSKSCVLDPLPAKLFKSCFDMILPIIVKIVNLSLQDGTLSANLKNAALSPLLKKHSLCQDTLSNYRPISNLSFVSKCIEKVVAARLKIHVHNVNLDELFQSAYKKGHSTETALLRVHNDILQEIDNKGCVILMLLDLSAAFDTVDHTILLERLHSRFGIRGQALNWFKSYLSERKQSVLINGVKSNEHDVLYGVPQGSVLGPALYLLYTSPLGEIVRHHGMSYHLYADDTQIYASFQPLVEGQQESCVSSMEVCLRDIETWMIRNKLKLNNDKSDVLFLRARHRPLPSIGSLMVGNETISPKCSARNIGVIFDDTLSMEKQVTSMCKGAFFHLRNIAKVRRYLSYDACETLIHALITMKLDYCNSILYGIPDYLIKKLQYAQNSAARLLTYTKKSSSITPILYDIHWLPIKFRIDFKILVLTYKAFHDMAPKYISALITKYKPTRSLRSASQNLLVVPRYNLATYGGRSFSAVAPVLWNSLPRDTRDAQSLDVFKRRIKTYLFKKAFI